MPTHTDSTSQLMAAVAAAPQDHVRRWVLADFLTEQGDPRGEFLQLQLNIARQQFTAAMRRRADELWAQHSAKWFRELKPFLANFRVEAGFPVEGWLAPGLTAEQLRAAFSLPAFVTLTRLHGPTELVAEALAAPTMTALSSVAVRSVRGLALVADRAIPGRIKRLELQMPLGLLTVRRILRAEALGSLEALAVSEPQDFRFANEGESALRHLTKHPSLASVELSAMELVILHLPQLWSASRWRRLAVVNPPSFDGPTGRRCVFERGADGAAHVQLEGMSRNALRRMRIVMPKETRRVAMFTVLCDDSRTSREDLVREYQGLGPVFV